MNPTTTPFHVGDWRVDASAGYIVRGDTRIELEPRKMRLLVAMAERPGEVVSLQTLTQAGWSDTVVSPDSVYQAIAQLRRALGDDSIATVPRKGYRLVAAVTFDEARSETPAGPESDVASVDAPRAGSPDMPRQRDRRRAMLGLGAITIAAGMTTWWQSRRDASPPIVRIAVLPFGHAGAAATGADALADGVARDVITAFERADRVQVIASNSAFQLRPLAASPIDLQLVRNRLDADVVLVGEVDHQDDHVRAGIRLLSAPEGKTLLSSNFEQPLDRAASLAPQIVDATLRSLKLAADVPTATATPDASRAYELFLLGMHAFQPRTSEAIREARGYFERAIDLDPYYARAYTSAAITWIAEADYGFGLDARSAAARAQPLIDKALTLQPELIDAAFAQSYVDIQLGRYEPAQERLQDVVRRAPGNAQAHFVLGVTYDWGANERAALEHYRIAQSLDPLNWLVQRRMGMALMWLGDHDEAKRRFDRTIELAPQSTGGQWGHASNAYSRGRLDEATRAYLAAIDVNPRSGILWSELAWCYLDLGLPDRARAALASQLPLSRLPGDVLRDSTRLPLVEGRLDELPTLISRSNLFANTEPGVAADAMLLASIAGQAIDARLLDSEVARMRADPTPWTGSYDVFLGHNNWLQMATLYVMLGRPTDAEPLLVETETLNDRIRRNGNRYHAMPFHEARIAALRGRRALALDKLDEAVAGGWLRSWWTRHDPAFAAMRTDPRFIAMLAKSDAAAAEQRRALG